jgi:hypothetical protein
MQDGLCGGLWHDQQRLKTKKIPLDRLDRAGGCLGNAGTDFNTVYAGDAG